MGPFVAFMVICTLIISSSDAKIAKAILLQRFIENSTILLFGDSLTKGLFRIETGPGYHPYCKKLSERLQNNNTKPFSIIEKGVNGETTDHMLGRFRAFLSRPIAEKIKIVVILGMIAMCSPHSYCLA